MQIVRKLSGVAVFRGLAALLYAAVAFVTGTYASILAVLPIRWSGYQGELPFQAIQIGTFIALLFLFWRLSWRWRWLLIVILPLALAAVVLLAPIHHNCGPCG